MQQKKVAFFLIGKKFSLHLWALKTRCRCLTHAAKQANYLYFGCHVVDAGNSWIPHLRSITCNINLIIWEKGKKNSMPPAVPMIWRGPISHLENCCLCLTKIERNSKKSKDKMQNQTVPTTIKPVAHGAYLPIPKPSSKWHEFNFAQEELQEGQYTSCDPIYFSHGDQKPHPIYESELNDPVRYLNLPKEQAELQDQNYCSGKCWLKKQDYLYSRRGAKNLSDVTELESSVRLQ